MKVWYGDGPLGIPGDEDGGSMSSWYVLSAMGFYQSVFLPARCGGNFGECGAFDALHQSDDLGLLVAALGDRLSARLWVRWAVGLVAAFLVGLRFFAGWGVEAVFFGAWAGSLGGAAAAGVSVSMVVFDSSFFPWPLWRSSH